MQKVNLYDLSDDTKVIMSVAEIKRLVNQQSDYCGMDNFAIPYEPDWTMEAEVIMTPEQVRDCFNTKSQEISKAEATIAKNTEIATALQH